MTPKTEKATSAGSKAKTSTKKEAAKKAEKTKNKPKAPVKSKAKETKAKATTKPTKKTEAKKVVKQKTSSSKSSHKKTKKTIKPKVPKTEKKVSAAKRGLSKVEAKKKPKFISGSKQVNLYSIGGKSLKKVKLPIVFDEVYRLDLIRRAVKAAQANRRQPYGPSPRSGMSHPSSTWGKGRGAARVQRLVDGRRAVESPNNVGGRRAHPPKVEKVWAEKINKKERNKARRAALAAITVTEMVAGRGHKFDNKISLPLVLEDKFETINKTKNALDIFKKVGVYDDVIRARDGKHIRAGKGKSRGRRYRRPKSLLIVVSNIDELKKGTGNLIGIDIVTPANLSVEDLAPGGDAGRLTIITESALNMMGDW
jgi:large subunit ribosomal protein L4e